MGLLEGKVALITGAGGGLGRAYALLFAKEGAKIVVNDLGGSRHGEGEDASMADRVVAEITDAGGEAIANHGSVGDAKAAKNMVNIALKTFGSIDIVVNNAGVLRDKTLVKMTDEMFDFVVDVHLKGTYLVTKAAFTHMAKSGGGSIINTSSYSGLKGNFGQSNYAAAKAGIAGFTRSVALEGRKFGVRVNAIAPVAKTRMTEELAMVPAAFEPEDISPLVCWLASDAASKVTGRIFAAHGSHYFEWLVEQTPGVDLGPDARWDVLEVGARFEEICKKEDLKNSEGKTVEEDPKLLSLFKALPSTFNAKRAGDWKANLVFMVGGIPYSLKIENGKSSYEKGMLKPTNATIKVDEAKTLFDIAAEKLDPQQAFMKGKMSTDNMGDLMKFAQFFDLSKTVISLVEEKEVVSDLEGLNHALIGKKYRAKAVFVEPTQIQAFAAATEDENPAYQGKDAIASPLFISKPLLPIILDAILDPELNADVMRLVHGEQDIYFHHPIKAWDLVAPRAEIGEIASNSKGETVKLHQRLMVDGQPAVEVISSIFIRGKDGKKSKTVSSEKVEISSEEILFEEKQQVKMDHPARYAAASDDKNSIHVDESFAKLSGFPSVVLHGLCTMAFAGRAIVNGFCEGDSTRLKRLRVRFSKPVLPGWILTTQVWKSESSKVFNFRVINQEGVVVIKDGRAEIL